MRLIKKESKITLGLNFVQKLIKNYLTKETGIVEANIDIKFYNEFESSLDYEFRAKVKRNIKIANNDIVQVDTYIVDVNLLFNLLNNYLQEGSNLEIAKTTNSYGDDITITFDNEEFSIYVQKKSNL